MLHSNTMLLTLSALLLHIWELHDVVLKISKDSLTPYGLYQHCLASQLHVFTPLSCVFMLLAAERLLYAEEILHLIAYY